MPFGAKLKEARLRKHFTQTELAKAVGVTNAAISNYESDVSSPKEPVLIRLMEVLGIDANYLFQDMVTHSYSSLPSFAGAAASVAQGDEPDEEDTWEIREALRRDPDMRILFSAAAKATPEHIRAAVAMLKALEPEDFSE